MSKNEVEERGTVREERKRKRGGGRRGKKKG